MLKSVLRDPGKYVHAERPVEVPPTLDNKGTAVAIVVGYGAV